MASSMSLEEEENYARMALLLTGISPRAVRSFFDKDNDLGPTFLPTTVQAQHQKLLWLKGKRIINQAQWDLSYPSNGTAPDSKNFDVTLMICLLRNLTTISPPINGFDHLPPSGETTDGADLARIKYYRNYLAHLDDGKIDAPFFNLAWSNIADAVVRIGGQQFGHECQELKVKILDQSNKEIMLEIKQSQTEVNELKKSLQDMTTIMETQKESQRHLQSDHDEKSKTITELVKSFFNLKTDHDEKTKEVENLIKSYDSLQSNHETLVKSYSSLETDHQTLAKSHETLRTDHDEKKREVENLTKSYVDIKSHHEKRKKEIDKLKEAQYDTVPWNIRGQINKKK